MKKRFLPFSILLAIMLLGQSITIADNGGHYVPRTQDAASAEQFMASLRVNQHTGLIDPALMIQAMQNNTKNDPVAPNDPLYWHNMGPDNMGGQTTAVLYDNQSNAIYIGAKGGGVFKSYNNGITWHQVDQKNLMVSCMTQAPDGTIYVGTGDADPALSYNGLDQFGISGNSFIGTGMYKISNDVITPIASTDPASDNNWGFINEIAIVGNAILAGTTTNLMYSVDNGETWEVLLEGKTNAVKALGNNIVASIGGKIYIGSVGQELVCHSSNNTQVQYNEQNQIIAIPKAAGLLDIATLNGNDSLIYAACIANNGNHKGFYVSENKGETWSVVYPEVANSGNLGHQVYDGYGLYNHGIVINPKNSNMLFVLGYNLWTLSKVTEEGNFVARKLTSGSTLDLYESNYLHVGIHAMQFNPKKGKENEFVIGTDGGVYNGVFGNNNVTTSNGNRNYVSTRMMDVAFSGKDTRVMASGFDHGTVYIAGLANTNTMGHATWINPTGYNNGLFTEASQGSSSAFSMLNTNTIFVAYKNSNIARSATLGGDWVSTNFTSALSVTDSDRLFHTPFVLFENVNDPYGTDSLLFKNTSEETLPAGTTVQCMSLNEYPFDYVLQAPLAAGDSIYIQDIVTAKLYMGVKNAVYRNNTPLQFSLESEWNNIALRNYGTPVCMSQSADGDVLFVGTKEGKVYRLTNLNDPNISIADTLITIGSGSQVVTSVAVDPRNANKIVVTLGNYGNDNYVYYCDNALSNAPTFTVKQANLPKMPVFSSIIEMSTGHVILGTERGIYKTTNINNPNWVADAENMGTVPVVKLKQQTGVLADRFVVKPSEDEDIVEVYEGIHNTGIIYAATYGRGVFRSENYKLSHDGVEDNTVTVAETKVSIYPNPVRDHATISFEAIGNQPVRYQVYDLTGRMVQTETIGSFNEGSHEHSINLGNLGAGSYILRLEQGQQVSTAKFIVY